MMHSIQTVLTELLGLGVEPKNLTFVQISLRGLLAFILSLAMLRLGDRRFLSKLSAFDALLGFMLASVMARAVNGSSPYFPTLGATLVLILFHRLLSIIAYHNPK